ncbi:MAG: RNA-binding S4 domain-containing protein [Peptoniphilus sp.]|nr:RNA-binding S4 domain-containing protein [Peptoniphilus sp.]
MEKDYITLSDFLKLNNIVQSGGEAKILIQSGQVMVNGEVETRRGKKLRKGDKVTFNSEEHLVSDENFKFGDF